jgi:hypothetical protein
MVHVSSRTNTDAHARLMSQGQCYNNMDNEVMTGDMKSNY